MEFLVVLVDVAVAALIVWWVVRGWYSKPALSQRLEQAGFRVAMGMFLAFLLPGWFANSRPAYDVLMIGVFFFLAITAVLYLASFVTAVIEGINNRTAMRLSGRPVPPRLRAAWKVALVTAGASFVLVLCFLYGVTFVSMLASRAYPLDSTATSELMSPWIIAGGIGFWVLVALAYVIQKARIWTAERDYAQLSLGIENRLREQRVELLATFNNDTVKE